MKRFIPFIELDNGKTIIITNAKYTAEEANKIACEEVQRVPFKSKILMYGAMREDNVAYLAN